LLSLAGSPDTTPHPPHLYSSLTMGRRGEEEERRRRYRWVVCLSHLEYGRLKLRRMT